MKTAITVILIIVAVAAVLFFFHSLLCFSLMYLVLIWTRTADYMNVSGVRMKAIIAQKSAGYTKVSKEIGKNGRGQRTGKILTGIRQEKTGEEKQKGGQALKQLTLGSLFDGIGGFCYAAGIPSGIDTGCTIKPLWAAEVEPNCIDITRYRFKDVMHVGSVTELKGDEIQPVDIITFGSPCQDLSIAGKRKGLKGNRSGLFTHAIRIIREMRLATNGKYPTFIIWENVPGAFSSNNGEDFRAVLEKSQTPIFQCLQVANGQPQEWLEGERLTPLGESLMLNIGEYPSVENESTLSEILEDNVPEKYYLSPKACLGILRRAKNKGRKLPDNLRIALEQKVAEGGRS